jgi:alginate O-acetyltransferase complex protein AlgI
MLFNSLQYIFFLPAVLLLYYLLPHKYRWILLFVSSCIFYMVLKPEYILVLFTIILIDYFSGIRIEQSIGTKRKAWLVASLVSNISLLAFFKYYNFANTLFGTLMWKLGGATPFPFLDIVLPIGLSFHTFQSMSYTIEVYRGNQKAERHLGYFSVYVLFFPQMVAGPIERFSRLGTQLKEEHPLTYDNIINGLRLILYGFFVKMVIADNLAPLVNEVYLDPSALNSKSILTGIFLFSIQIYADFYGYSLIAVGSARMMGIRLMDNFKTPYLAASIHEFWQRWHISLSTWFRDYLYIPLGGNKVRTARWILNILLVFTISGLWHGANKTFVIWGFLHGALYLVEYFSGKFIKLSGNWWLHAIGVIKNFTLVSLIWVFFRSENIQKAKLVFISLIKNRWVHDTFTINPRIWILLLLFGLSDWLLFNSRADEYMQTLRTPVRWVAYTALLFCILALAGVDKQAFIYFQF